MNKRENNTYDKHDEYVAAMSAQNHMMGMMHGHFIQSSAGIQIGGATLQ